MTVHPSRRYPAGAAPALRIRMLGLLEATVDGQFVALRRGRPRRLLLTLALRRGRRASMDSLVDELWPEDDKPVRPYNALHVVVSYVRGALDTAGGAGGAVQTVDGGYRLVVAPSDVDAFVFEDTVHQAALLGSPHRRLAALDEALALWRGDALADAAYEPFAQPAIARLDEVRVGALAQRAQALLDLGCHAEAVSELRTLVEEHPLHEHLRVLLMTGLYRCGRQSEALRQFERARVVLRDELGLDPGPALRAAGQAVLEQSLALDWMPTPLAVGPSPATELSSVRRIGSASPEEQLAGASA